MTRPLPRHREMLLREQLNTRNPMSVLSISDDTVLGLLALIDAFRAEIARLSAKTSSKS